MNAPRSAAPLALAFALAALTMAGCAPKQETVARTPERYEVQGEIVGLPSVGSREVMIRHEAIPGFRDDAGKVVGMAAMTMPFMLGESVSIDGFAIGDTVAFTLEVDWSSKRDPVRIAKLGKSAMIQKFDLEDGAIPIPGQTPGNSTPSPH